MKIKFISAFLLILFAFFACQDDNDPMDNPMDDDDEEIVVLPDSLLFDYSGIPYDNLSDYHFFSDLAELEPHPYLLPYDLTTSLFSNYASKQRFVYLPKGKSANFREDEQLTLEFPDSTVIIKTFYYNNDFTDLSQGKNILETRLLIKLDGEWIAEEYVWNEEQTDAERYISGKIVNVSWTHFDGSQRTSIYGIPNKNECKGCHELNEEVVLIGPKARFLNKDFDYEDGTMNQLLKWESLGKLTNLPPLAEVSKAGTWDNDQESLDTRARSYLDINCAHCHNIDGPANNSGLFLDFYQTDPTRLGVCKNPVAAGNGSGGFSYSILPGNPDESIMIYRLNSLEPDVSMPELARSVIHEEGLQLLRDWILEMEGDCD